MPSKKVTVWDAAGIPREVYPVDAREIVEQGGSYESPTLNEKNETSNGEQDVRSKTKMHTTLEEWARGHRVNLSLVFTDIVHSTLIAHKLGDREWVKVVLDHMQIAKKYAQENEGFTVKAIGDAVMVAFKNATNAIEFAESLYFNTGYEYLLLRIGINSGDVYVTDNDIYGLNVNFASRVQSFLPYEGIAVSESVKTDYEKDVGSEAKGKFSQRTNTFKGFGNRDIWIMRNREMIKYAVERRKAIVALLGKPSLELFPSK